MTASRGSYEVTLITKKDSAWVPDKQQKNCYVCTKVKLRGGNRHHCRLCGNVACKDCCPRICKKCLAEKLVPSSPSGSFGGGSSEITVQFQRLCQLKCKQIKWKRVEMIDKIYYEPVYIISEDSTNICIVRNVDGDYFAIDKNTLFLAPEKENMLDSIQCLLHGFINRSSESSISLRKPLYALGEDNSILNESMINKRKSFSSNNNKILKRSNIFSFYPMLQKESYKLEGFLLKSSLHKMNINNVQLFHFVSDEESPKKIPAFNSDSNVHSDDEKQINNNDIIISANSRRKSPSMGDLKKKNIAVLELELDSFKKGYQEMRKMYEEYVSANESKVREHEELISKLQKEVDDTTQSKAKYKQAVDINANQVRELQEQILKLKSEYQIKLNSQSDKYKNSSEKTTNDAQSKLIESCKNLEVSNNKIKQLEFDIEQLKNSTEAAEKIKIEVNKVKAEKETECKQLSEKIQSSEKQLIEQKKFYEDKLAELEENSSTQLAALKSNSDKQVSQVMEKLKADIAGKNDILTKNQEEIAKLQACVSEEKSNNDGLNAKLNTLNTEFESCKQSENQLKKEYETLKIENNHQIDEYKELESTSTTLKEEQDTKINNLDKQIDELKKVTEEESKTNEERTLTLEKQVSDLKNVVNEKNEATTAITQELTDAQQEIESYKNNESALGSQVLSLKEQIAEEQKTLTDKEKEYQESMNKIQSDMENQITEKDNKLNDTQNKLNAKEAELTTKLEEFSNAEAKIQELDVNLQAEKQNLQNEKKNNATTIATYIQKEERIHNSCKSLFTKFTAIREEMKSVQEEQISQLEEVSSFFGDFSPLLEKVFEFNQTMIDDLLVKYKRELSLRRKYFNMVQDLRGNIRVFCRFRPLLPFELKKGYTECVKFPQEGAIEIIDDKSKKLKFEYDQVYTPKTSQAQVSEDSTEYIQSVMDGYNVSIFAYGQTGSGKTYTMEGPSLNKNDMRRGMIPRSVEQIFQRCNKLKDKGWKYKCNATYLEIYNEKIRDLLLRNNNYNNNYNNNNNNNNN
eukprot:193172_1